MEKGPIKGELPKRVKERLKALNLTEDEIKALDKYVSPKKETTLVEMAVSSDPDDGRKLFISLEGGKEKFYFAQKLAGRGTYKRVYIGTSDLSEKKGYKGEALAITKVASGGEHEEETLGIEKESLQRLGRYHGGGRRSENGGGFTELTVMTLGSGQDVESMLYPDLKEIQKNAEQASSDSERSAAEKALERIGKELLNEWDQDELLRQLMVGVHSFHQVGIIHRDLKTNNILWDNENKKSMIIDLGENLHVGEPGTSIPGEFEYKDKTVVGTSIYLAPEALNGKIYSTGTDIFATGMIAADVISKYNLIAEKEKNTRSTDQEGILQRGLLASVPVDLPDTQKRNEAIRSLFDPDRAKRGNLLDCALAVTEQAIARLEAPKGSYHPPLTNEERNKRLVHNQFCLFQIKMLQFMGKTENAEILRQNPNVLKALNKVINNINERSILGDNLENDQKLLAQIANLKAAVIKIDEKYAENLSGITSALTKFDTVVKANPILFLINIMSDHGKEISKKNIEQFVKLENMLFDLFNLNESLGDKEANAIFRRLHELADPLKKGEFKEDLMKLTEMMKKPKAELISSKDESQPPIDDKDHLKELMIRLSSLQSVSAREEMQALNIIISDYLKKMEVDDSLKIEDLIKAEVILPSIEKILKKFEASDIERHSDRGLEGRLNTFKDLIIELSPLAPSSMTASRSTSASSLGESTESSSAPESKIKRISPRDVVISMIAQLSESHTNTVEKELGALKEKMEGIERVTDLNADVMQQILNAATKLQGALEAKKELSKPDKEILARVITLTQQLAKRLLQDAPNIEAAPPEPKREKGRRTSFKRTLSAMLKSSTLKSPNPSEPLLFSSKLRASSSGVVPEIQNKKEEKSEEDKTKRKPK